MSIWGVVVILVGLFLAVALMAGWRGKEGRLARRQVRQLRGAEGRGMGAAEIGEHRHRTEASPPTGGSPGL